MPQIRQGTFHFRHGIYSNRRKKVLDEFRSQFAVFETQRAAVILYGRNSTEELFYLTTNR